ncbi:uncharacterized protein LOC125645466 isoform X2 [Ostrea edulis]|uniref:uncharacterized protein LOC125645466 isoform X2 n=1 Tax=Ostrea edulis TaxID=37623 RepID=UPI0024AECA47|nr:uncharacterized protein LOC125645466 isoform X2 [Ostrea edulis]
MSVWCWVTCILVLQILKQINGFDLVRLTKKGADDGSYTVEVNYDQKWRTVCGWHWSSANARVVCRQTGQSATRCVAEFRLSKDLEEEEAEAVNLNYQCTGNETALHRCPYDFSSTHGSRIYTSCSRQPRFAVICGTQCPAWRYSEDCLPCPCNQNNTEKCNDKSGKCTCKAGFSGETCDCQDGKHTCNLTTSFCHMDNGNPVCLCKKGVTSTSQNKCNGFGLRFADRAANDTGEVEFYNNGTWNALCIMRLSNTEIVDVICRQLGLPMVHVHTSAFLSKYIPKTDLPDYQIAETVCEGTETSLVDCKMTMVPAMSCNIAVGIMCSSACPNWRFGEKCNLCSCNKTNSESCDPSTGECKCKSGFTGATCDCLQGNNPCNETISECHAQLGKPTCLCKTEFIHKNYRCIDPIRLANLTTSVTTSGSKLYEGRVELYVNGCWGTICDDAAHPGVKMVEVLCRNLGLPSTYSEYAGAAYYGMGMGPIHYSFVHCTGKEASVSQCYTSRASYCSHSEDLGIRCGEECPDFRFGSDCLHCQCVRSNTQFCNKTSGECVCKDGYEGQTCSCEKGKHTCDLQTSVCENNMCYCKFENNETKSSCFERLRLDKENGSYLQYHANNQWNYLCNSAMSSRFSAEILCRVLHQPTKITKLEEKYSSPVGYKFTVDESCRNPWLPNRAECLTFENTSTACYNGIVILQCLEECPDGMYFKELGFGCEECPCNRTNTERCDKTGKCICKSGYEGALCNCVKNTCNTAVAFCQNNQNGTKCLCKPGYENRGYNCEDSMKLELSNQSYFKRVVYKIDSSWVYAYTLSSYVSPSERAVCERMGLPMFYNKLGEETIQVMNKTEFECMNKEYVAMSLNYSKCINQTTPRHWAFSMNVKTVSCLKDCPKMMFFNGTSSECVLCSCNKNNTVSCNQTTEECNCKAGFFGPSCDCIQNQHNCNNTYSYCSFQGSAPTCTCRLGFYGENLGCFEPLRFIRNTGVLELYHRGEWKLISTSDKWNDDESKVICRQLGLPTFYVRYTIKHRSATNLKYSDYNRKKKLTEVSCSGEERQISQCSFGAWSYSASYTPLAIIECRRDCPDFLYGPTCKRCECNQQYSRYCNKSTGECVCKSGYSGDTCDCVQGSHFCNATYAFCGLPTPYCYCRDQYNRRGLNCEDSLRFYNNVIGREGILQIYKNRSWNTFCDDSFARDEALVACRQLRLPTRYVTFATRKYHQRIPSEYSLGIVYTIQCNGNETSLSDCKKFSTHGSYCYHNEDVYLQCFSECPKWTYGDECENQCLCNQTNSLSCDEDTGKCSCKPGYLGDLCNCKTGVHQCKTAISICHANSSGDGVCLCKAGLSDRDYQNEGCYKEYVRLINQTSSNEAAVEMFHSGMWGGICKTGWTKKNAQVVCQQFGLPSDNAQMSRRLTTMPSSYFLWTNITCNGTEKSLLDCVRSTSSSTYCYGRKAAVIVCPKDPWIRLMLRKTTRTKTSGMLQVYYNNKWGDICAGGIGNNAARVACRELGLPTKYTTKVERSAGSHVRHFQYIICNGDEESLADCSADKGDCYSYSSTRAKISCDSVCPYMQYGENCQFNCPCNRQNTASCGIETGQCVCKSGYTGFSCGCTAGSHNCNTTVSDCHIESGKILCICKKGFTSSKHGCIENVRLNSDNILLLFEMGGWKYACRNKLWTRKNDLVVCRQLNQSSDILYSTSRYWSYPTSNNVITCNGTEEMLANCSNTTQTSSCVENTKILCGNCPNWKYSSDCSKSCDCNREYSLGCNVNNGTCICRDNFKGVDCSCHAATADPCSGQHSICKFDRCVCEEGSFNQSTSCSDLKDIIYFCSFQTYLWRDTCSIRTLKGHGNRNTYVSYGFWRPKAGSDDLNYLYVGIRPYYASADSYFNEMNLTLHIARKQFCLYFDYVVSGRGSITVSTIDSMNLESTVATLSGRSPKNWTTKYTEINGKRPINQIKIRLEEKTAIDKIVAAVTSCVCPDWTYGQNCDKCACVRLHTQSCDKTRGTCQCKAGYTGEACQCEDNGKPCLHDIRLVNGNTTNMGRVEVVTGGIWSTVCDRFWDDYDATVVCKHLGIGRYGIAVFNAGFGKGIGPVIVGNVKCQGMETDFMECPFARSSCDHSNDAGVICVNVSNSIRLRDGSDHTQGRLEIKIDGKSWGTVCDDGFSVVDARVACRQLDLPTRNVKVKKSAYYGPGKGRILLSNLRCNGNEMTIQSCPATKYPTRSSCGRYEDVGISCSNDDKAVVYSCSFETDFEICSIVNYGKMKWRRDSRRTPSDNTGPYTAKRGKYYVYTEANRKSTGDKGVMKIPLSILNSTRYNCFRFYFHMRGDDMGDLKITTEDRFGSEIVRWSKSGHYGSRWNRGYVSISANTFKIKITGIRGNGYQSDIALDDFKILQGHCECDKWKYGLMCEKTCNCRRNSSKGCDSKTGSCVCRSGWSGKTCNFRN